MTGSRGVDHAPDRDCNWVIVAARRLRAVAAICRRPVHAAAGRLQIAGASARRHRRFPHHRRNGRAARRLDRPGARQHRRRASRAAGGRGGKVTIIEHRNELPESIRRSSPTSSGSTPRSTIRSSLHKYLGDYLPTKRGQGLDWTLGEDAVKLGQKTGYDYALFLHAEDQVASGGRIALGVLGLAGCIVGFCAPNVGGAAAARLCLARRPQDRRSRVVQRRRRGEPGAGGQVRRPPHPGGRRSRWSSACSAG